jgi:hypothetical protein
MMKTFSQYLHLVESFKNFLPKHEEEKRRHAEEIHGMLHRAYESQGGLKGSGFASPEEMVNKIPMWKISRKDGKINAVAMYKDSNGRKRVAVATDGSPEGKNALSSIMKDDLKRNRSHVEISGKSLAFSKRHMNVGEFAKTYDEAHDYHTSKGEEIRRPHPTDPEMLAHPELHNNLYSRKIGDEWHTKVLLGTTGKQIK